MSRREDRDSDSRRRRSLFDREPSPKRSRRDGKPETERSSNPGSGERAEQNERQRRRLQDALPLEAPLGSDNKADIKKTSSKDAQRKGYDDSEGAKRSSDPSEVPPPRSRSFFQHDERNHAGQGGRSSSLRTTSERGWWKDTRVQRDGKESEKKSSNDSRREENLHQGEDGSRAWKHDEFFEMEANPLPPPPPPPPPPPSLTRKRPSFREQKILGDDKSKRESNTDLQESERKYDRNRYQSHHDRPARDEPRPYMRERYCGGNKFRGREDYSARGQPYNRTMNTPRVEKWKHDMFDEANRSPSPKKDEDRLAKIEALLAS